MIMMFLYIIHITHISYIIFNHIFIIVYKQKEFNNVNGGMLIIILFGMSYNI